MATIEGIIDGIKSIDNTLEPIIQTVTKNTVRLAGLCIRSENKNIAPCIYIDKYLNDSISDSEAVNIIMQIYHDSDKDFDPFSYINKDYILNHLYIGLQRKDDACEYITRNSQWDDIIEYMYVHIEFPDSAGSIKLNYDMLKRAQITEEQAWELATKSTCDELVIEPMSSVLEKMLEIESDTLADIDNTMFVVSNPRRTHGAAVLINTEAIKQWAVDKGFLDGIIIIFSSIHEAILVPAKGIDINHISEMINIVNEESVDDTEQLATKAYFLSV